MKPKFNMKGYPKGGGTKMAKKEPGCCASMAPKAKKVSKMQGLK